MIDDEIPKHRSKKNTRKWCKGKEGIEHKPIWQEDKKRNWIASVYLQFVCQVCGKELDSYFEWKNIVLRKNEYERPTIGSTEPLKKKVKSD